MFGIFCIATLLEQNNFWNSFIPRNSKTNKAFSRMRRLRNLRRRGEHCHFLDHSRGEGAGVGIVFPSLSTVTALDADTEVFFSALIIAKSKFNNRPGLSGYNTRKSLQFSGSNVATSFFENHVGYGLFFFQTARQNQNGNPHYIYMRFECVAQNTCSSITIFITQVSSLKHLTNTQENVYEIYALALHIFKSYKMTSKMEVGGLGLSLTTALLSFPQLLDDFPAIIASLDTGECVNVAGISDTGLRDALTGIMSCLPLQYDPCKGWYKATEVTSVGGILLMDLLYAGHIKQPASLSEAESISSRTAPVHLLHLLQKYPALRMEIPGLLDSLLGGQAVQLDGLPDQQLATGLTGLLQALGAIEGEDGLSIPDGATDSDASESGGSGVGGSVKQSMLLLRGAILQVTGGGSNAPAVVTQPDSSSHKRRRPSAGTSITKGSTDNRDSERERERERERKRDSDSHSDNDSDGDLCKIRSKGVCAESDSCVTKDVRIGVAMPPGYVKRTTSELEGQDKNDEDSDDDIGPLLEWQAQSRRSRAVAPAPVIRGKDQLTLTSVLSTATPSSSSSTAKCGVDEEEQDQTPGREEWMLTPGDCAGAAASALDNTFGKERKFASGKGASLAAKNARHAASTHVTPMNTDAIAVLAEFDKLRGPSLMEMHTQKAKALKAAKAKAGGSQRSAFNYERDVGGFRNKVDSALRDQMLAEAKQLDERFDKSMK